MVLYKFKQLLPGAGLALAEKGRGGRGGTAGSSPFEV